MCAELCASSRARMRNAAVLTATHSWEDKPCGMHRDSLMQTRAKPLAAGAVVSLGGAAPPKI